MDKASTHRMTTVQDVCDERGITKCFNIGYSPEFNPIENTFAEVKRIFNKARLEALANDQAFDMKKNIKKAFKVITPEYVKACAARSLRLL